MTIVNGAQTVGTIGRTLTGDSSAFLQARIIEVVEDAVARVLSGVEKIIDKDYADAYLAPLFKNVKKCADIRMKSEKA